MRTVKKRGLLAIGASSMVAGLLLLQADLAFASTDGYVQSEHVAQKSDQFSLWELTHGNTAQLTADAYDTVKVYNGVFSAQALSGVTQTYASQRGYAHCQWWGSSPLIKTVKLSCWAQT